MPGGARGIETSLSSEKPTLYVLLKRAVPNIPVLPKPTLGRSTVLPTVSCPCFFSSSLFYVSLMGPGYGMSVLLCIILSDCLVAWPSSSPSPNTDSLTCLVLGECLISAVPSPV